MIVVLTRDVAANSMLIEKRKALHELTAQAIEVLNAERLDDQPGRKIKKAYSSGERLRTG